MAKLGLIAGNRTFPIHVAKAAKRLGYTVIAVGLKEETDPALADQVDQMHWVSFSEIGTVPDFFKAAQVQELILAGQIKAERLLQNNQKFDGVARGLMRLMPDRSGSSAMKMAVSFLESKGFKLLDSGKFLKDWIPQTQGVLTQRVPTIEEQADLQHGLELARALDRMGIGQSILIRHKAVVAIEAMEGTDAAIARAGQVAGPGVVLVKACGPDHDMRFDIPVVGPETLHAMEQAGVGCLGVEAKRTLLFEREMFLEQADRQKLSVVVL